MYLFFVLWLAHLLACLLVLSGDRLRKTFFDVSSVCIFRS